MIVRILNEKLDFDGFYDCEYANIYPNDTGEFFLSCGNQGRTDRTRGLQPGDEIYYMNNFGKTIHSDCRMLVSKQ